MLSLYPETSSDVQEQASYVAARAAVFHGEGRLEEALSAGLESLESGAVAETAVFSYQQVKQGFVHAVEAAFALGRAEQVEELLARVEAVSRGVRPPYIEAHTHRFRGRLESDAARNVAAATGFRELGMPFWVAVTQLEHAELLGGGEEAEHLRAAAREVFERLEATPWLERATAAAPVR